MNNKRYILFVILWMGFIFYMSHQPAEISKAQSNKVIDIIKHINNSNSTNNSNKTNNSDKFINSFVIRKTAHMFLYASLSILMFICIYNGENMLKSIILSLVLCFLYACSDEFHQLFIVGRSGELRDVLVDFMGSSIGIFIISSIYSLKKLKYTRYTNINIKNTP